MPSPSVSFKGSGRMMGSFFVGDTMVLGSSEFSKGVSEKSDIRGLRGFFKGFEGEGGAGSSLVDRLLCFSLSSSITD